MSSSSSSSQGIVSDVGIGGGDTNFGSPPETATTKRLDRWASDSPIRVLESSLLSDKQKLKKSKSYSSYQSMDPNSLSGIQKFQKSKVEKTVTQQIQEERAESFQINRGSLSTSSQKEIENIHAQQIQDRRAQNSNNFFRSLSGRGPDRSRMLTTVPNENANAQQMEEGRAYYSHNNFRSRRGRMQECNMSNFVPIVVVVALLIFIFHLCKIIK